MSANYDFVFVTHLPAFYKVNLYNAIAQKSKVFVIFIASGSQDRTADFTQATCAFDYVILNQGAFETRHRWQSVLALRQCMRGIRYRKLIVGGWDLWEYWYLVLTHPKAKNGLALESSRFESQLQGLKKIIKQIFLSRIATVFASGKAHEALLETLGYACAVRKTLGVGLMQYSPVDRKARAFSGRFLFVGRLAPEKNVQTLLAAFRALPQYTLTVVGQGPLKAALVAQSPSNVSFCDHVPNSALKSIYSSHDAFILPSQREPWGLVVEEALYYGLPVIVSDKVGSGPEFVEMGAGVMFLYHSVSQLIEAIEHVAQNYVALQNRALSIDLVAKDVRQVAQYWEALS